VLTNDRHLALIRKGEAASLITVTASRLVGQTAMRALTTNAAALQWQS
jgi:hypothetical protein